MLDQLPKPAIIAHRGASAYAPENTLASFSLALKQGADAIELDVKLTQDQHVVVLHDQTVNRTTDGNGDARTMTLAEIRKLDSGSYFDVEFKGEQVPTLDEVFKAVGQLTYLNIELTNYATPFDDLAERVSELVYHFQLSHRIFFSSFNPFVLYRIRKLVPEAPVGLLALPGRNGFLARSWLGSLLKYSSLNMEKSDIDRKIVTKLHTKEKKVFAYTVNDRHQMEDLFLLNIDGIFTDDPPLARQSLEGLSIKLDQ